MTSRDRVLAAFAHANVDRVPIDYATNAGIDGRLKSALGIAADDDEALRLALGVDFRGVGPADRGGKRFADIPGRVIWQETGIRTRWIENASGGYCLSPTHLLQDNSPVENVIAMYQAAHRYGATVRG